MGAGWGQGEGRVGRERVTGGCQSLQAMVRAGWGQGGQTEGYWWVPVPPGNGAGWGQVGQTEGYWRQFSLCSAVAHTQSPA